MQCKWPAARSKDHKCCRNDVEQDPGGEKRKNSPGNQTLALFGNDGDAVSDQCSLYKDDAGEGEWVHGHGLVESAKVVLFGRRADAQKVDEKSPGRVRLGLE